MSSSYKRGSSHLEISYSEVWRAVMERKGVATQRVYHNLCVYTPVNCPLSLAQVLIHQFNPTLPHCLLYNRHGDEWSEPRGDRQPRVSSPSSSYFRHEAFKTLCYGSYMHCLTHTHDSYMLSGHWGDVRSVGAVSITVDIVCHRHNGVGFQHAGREVRRSRLVSEFTFSARHFWWRQMILFQPAQKQQLSWTMGPIRPVRGYKYRVN